MIEQLLLIYVVSALCFFCWQVWVYHTGWRSTVEHLKLQVNNRDKTIGSFQDANKSLNESVSYLRNQNDSFAQLLKQLQNENKLLKTNKIGETVAKKTAKTKTKKPMKK